MAHEDAFSVQMRNYTRSIHKTSDTLVNAKFALSLTNPLVWTEALLSFYEVFLFLEEAKKRLNLEDINRFFVHDEMYRVNSFELDLQHYLGNEWRLKRKTEAPGVKCYIEHLQKLEASEPLTLLAYYYHLYLGILSGGQILKRKRKLFDKVQISKADEVRYEEKVLSYNNMEIIPTKAAIKEQMDEFGKVATGETKQLILNESIEVFKLNNLIVGEIKGQNLQFLTNIIVYAGIPLMIFVVLIAVLMKSFNS